MRSAIAAATVALALPAALSAQANTLRTEDGVGIHYEVSGEGPPLVLVHGWTHDARVWELQIPVLERRFTVLRYDRRGWGRSGGRPDVSRDPVDLVRLMAELGWSDAHVVGHSQGGEVALRFVLAYPDRVRSLVLYGAPPPEDFSVPWTGPDALPSPPEMRAIVEAGGLDSLAAVLFSGPLARGFEGGGAGLEIARELWSENAGRAFREPAPPSKATPAPSMTRLSEVTVPALVLTGEHEMTYFRLGADAVAYALPDARRVTVPGGGHALHLQEPERFTAELHRFLREVEGR